MHVALYLAMQLVSYLNYYYYITALVNYFNTQQLSSSPLGTEDKSVNVGTWQRFNTWLAHHYYFYSVTPCIVFMCYTIKLNNRLQTETLELFSIGQSLLNVSKIRLC